MRASALTRRLRQNALAFGTVAACLSGVSPAHAIVSTSNPDDWLASDSRFAGEAYLSIGGTHCSGSLLAGGAYVLTAAHCVTGSDGTKTTSPVSVQFRGGTVSASVSSPSQQISLFATWHGQGAQGRNLGWNNDLALLRLDTAVNAVTGYQVLGVDPIRATVVLAGYGYVGIGASGFTTSSGLGTLHWGANEYETIFPGRSSYLFDFDDGDPAQNALQYFGTSSLGLPKITPAGSPREAMIAPGDSGGASFVVANGGTFYLAGVHSFLAQLNLPGVDVDLTLNGSFGEIGGDTVLFTAANAAWITQVTGLLPVTSVPEPASGAILLAGGAMLAVAWSRRRRFAQHIKR